MNEVKKDQDPAAYLAERPVLSRRQARILALVAATASTFFISLVVNNNWSNRLEGITLDWRFRLRGTRPPPKKIIIVEIDEKSRRELKREGRQFNLREHLPAAINQLADAGALAIGLDIWFEDLTTPEIDQHLAEAIHRANVVLAVTHTEGKLLRAPAPLLAGQPSEGVITVYPDHGNVLRRLPPKLYLNLLNDNTRDGIAFVPHFPIALAWYAALQLDEKAAISFDEEGVAHVGPFYARPRELIDFVAMRSNPDAAGPHWQTYRFAEVIKGQFDIATIDGAIILIGESRTLQDSFIMPLSDDFSPGTYYHANVLAQIIEGRHFDDSWTTYQRNLALTAMLTLMAGLYAWHVRPWWKYRRGTAGLLLFMTIGILFFLGGYIIAATLCFDRYVLLPVVSPLFGAGMALALGFAGQWVITSINTKRLDHRARQIEALFGQCVSHSVLEALKHSPERIRRPETREVSVLFCDLRSFTAYSAEMPPLEVAEMLNEYYNYITNSVFDQDGFVDKFVGDEIMAVFSVPFEQPDHAVRAVRAAMAIKQQLAELNRVRQARGQKPLDCGLGIHCGPAAAGHIGSRDRSNYTVVGTTVNLAARIQGFTRGGEILVSEAVRERLPADIAVHFWKSVEIRGATGLHNLYQVDMNTE